MNLRESQWEWTCLWIQARVLLLAGLLATVCIVRGQPNENGTTDEVDQQDSGQVDADSAVGGNFSFVTLEAEDPNNEINGTVVKAAPGYKAGLAEYEASGHAYVALQEEGDSIEFNHVGHANSIVVRYCIPDDPKGGGTKATLSLYVNGKKRQTICLSSEHSWLYGPAGKNGQSNDPNDGTPHTFWDEAGFRITGEDLQTGDQLSLQVDPGDDAAYYWIDSIDLEQVGQPLRMPGNGHFLSVKDFGATGNGVTDDTNSIARCIAAATTQRKGVFFPEGNYVQTSQFQLDGIAVQGAGIWYTKLIGTVAASNWAGSVGFCMKGHNVEVSDLAIDSPALTSRAQSGGKAINGSPTNWKVHDVWIIHTLVGLWMSGASHGVVSDCRIRCTYADGINLNCGSSDNIVENNHVRGTGDDGIALLSEATSLPSNSNIVRHNTVIANWWGANCDVASGTDQTVENNLLEDNAGGAALAVSLSSSYPMHSLVGADIRNNTLARGGGFRGSLWISVGDASVVSTTFEDNEIIDSFGTGIELTGSGNQETTYLSNTVTKPAGIGILIRPVVIGKGVFRENVVTDAGDDQFRDNASSFYTVQEEKNSWQ